MVTHKDYVNAILLERNAVLTVGILPGVVMWDAVSVVSEPRFARMSCESLVENTAPLQTSSYFRKGPFLKALREETLWAEPLSFNPSLWVRGAFNLNRSVMRLDESAVK